MADTTIAAKLTADASQAITSVKNFKQELRLAQEEVVAITQKFGATSKEAANAAQKAALLKDAVGDAKSLVDAFNPDTKFRAFGASINTVVGGFTALQGVLGLVGVESEEVQKALLKVQSALAISQGIAQLQEGISTFKNLGAVIKATTIFQQANTVATNLAAGAMRLFGVSTTATSTSMNVLKGAIIATGIGALVVLLGVAANAMGLFSSKSDDAADSQEKLKQQIEGVNESLAIQNNFFANEEKLAIAKAKRAGATEAEIFAIQTKFRRLNYDATVEAYDKLKNVDADAAAKLLKQIQSQNISGQVAQIEFEDKEIERRREVGEKAAQRAREQREKLVAELAKEQAQQGLAGLNKFGGLDVEIPKTTEQLQIENEAAARREARLEEEELNRRAAESYAQFTEIHTRNVQERIAAEQLEYQNRVTLANASASVLNSLSSLVGQQTAAGKVFAIASATIDTFVAANAILRNTAKTPAGGIPGFAIAQMAAVILTGLINVKKIASVKVPGGGGGGAAAPAPTAAPLVPQKPQQGTTTLDQDSLNAIGNATTRAFVLESDITNNQERVRRLNRAARIGG